MVTTTKEIPSKTKIRKKPPVKINPVRDHTMRKSDKGNKKTNKSLN